jgi:lambda repressor-like predicted transcriptional regulator
MQRVARRLLHPQFILTVHTSGYSIAELSRRAQFPRPNQLSKLLNRAVPCSTVQMTRLQTLAKAIGYDGPIFITAPRVLSPDVQELVRQAKAALRALADLDPCFTHELK